MKEPMGDKSMLFSSSASGQRRARIYAPGGTKEVTSSKENKVLVGSEVEGPLNEEARNAEEF